VAAEPLTLLAMVAGFGVLVALARWPAGVSLAAAAWLGAAVNGHWFPLRHLVEGAFSYLDPILVIATATIFMRMLADGGSLGVIGASVERRLGGRPAILLPVLMAIVMFPGMITGSSTASVLTTGAMAASILIGLGAARERAAAFVAMGSIFGMIAPPVNIPAMLIGGGIDLPYVGFMKPLLLVSVPLALATAYALGRDVLQNQSRIEFRQRRENQSRIEFREKREIQSGIDIARAMAPIVLTAVLMAAPQIWPRRVPDIGLPLVFVIAAGVTLLLSPRFRVLRSLHAATDEALPVLGILTGVGAFIQVMTLTGARGWLVAQMLGAPSWALIVAAGVSMPLFGAVSAFGSASVLGVPFLLALLGRNEVVTTAALSLLAGLGDLMLPAALAATLAARVAGVEDRMLVLRRCVVPALAAMAAAVAVLWFAPAIGRWLN
jgi:TRAP-type C4-dicarboxylate transport system permease large subunit